MRAHDLESSSIASNALMRCSQRVIVRSPLPSLRILILVAGSQASKCRSVSCERRSDLAVTAQSFSVIERSTSSALMKHHERFFFAEANARTHFPCQHVRCGFVTSRQTAGSTRLIVLKGGRFPLELRFPFGSTSRLPTMTRPQEFRRWVSPTARASFE